MSTKDTQRKPKEDSEGRVARIALRLTNSEKKLAERAAEKADRKLANWAQWVIRRELGLVEDK